MLEMTKEGLVETDIPRPKKVGKVDRPADETADETAAEATDETAAEATDETDYETAAEATDETDYETADEATDETADETIDVYDIPAPCARVFIRCTRHCYFVEEPVLSENLAVLKNRIVGLLRHSKDLTLFDGSKSVRQNALEKACEQILRDYRIRLGEDRKQLLLYFIFRDFAGAGKIEPVLNDPLIEDISCNGYRLPVYVHHRLYGSLQTNISFEPDELDSLVRRLARVSDKTLTISKPLADAALPDGSRAQLSLGSDITTKGSTFTIRKFTKEPLRPEDLVRMGTFPPGVMAYLRLSVESNMNIMFAGGTASGKTTAVNAIGHFIPPRKKIVSIEDTREIVLPHLNWVSGISRDPIISETASENGIGASGLYGGISLYDLLKAAMRQRPEYIIVGEVRGSEAYVLFQAMSTGHATLSTIHAESVSRLIHRLENPPMSVPRSMIQSLDILVVLGTVRTRGRDVKKCLSVHEIIRTDPRTGEVLISDIFRHEMRNDSSVTGLFSRSKAMDKITLRTGQKPHRLLKKLKEYTSLFEETLKGIGENTADQAAVVRSDG